jgi:polyisoprenoid-binding protein YceI
MTESTVNASLPALTPGDWSLDASASTVAFQHKSVYGLITVRGTFPVGGGEGHLAADGTASGTVIIDAAGLDTKHKKRDTHLRSKDFFETDQHPTITFTAERAHRASAGGTEVRVDGRLKVKDIEKPVSFLANATTTDADSVTLTAETTLDRHDYGLAWNQMGMIKGLTTLAVTLRFTRA